MVLPGRVALLRAGLTAIILVTVEVARGLLGVPAGFVADVAALYLSILLGGLFVLPARNDAPGAPPVPLDEPVGLAAFLLAPVGPVIAVALLILAAAPGSATPGTGMIAFGLALVASLVLLAATLLLPAAAWSGPANRNPLARAANAATHLAATLFRPGAVGAGVVSLVRALA